MMKAAMYQRFGSVEELHLGELPAPVPARDQVLITVRAASINVIDSRVRSGLMGPLVNKKFPKVPGADFSGVVTGVAPDVTSVSIGDEVYGATDPFKGGALAEHVVVPAGQIAAKPRGLSFEQAAAIPVAGLAALYSVRELGGLKPGDSLLVHGASGGVGLFAIQLAKELGAKVTAVAGPAGLGAVRAAGADVVIDYKTPGGAGFQQPFDVIINASGKMPFSVGNRYLNPGGRLIEPSPTIPIYIGSKLANLFRSKKHLMLQTFPRSKDLAYLSSLVESGRLTVTVAKVYPLDLVKQAFGDQEKGGILGKIVITVSAA
jgi:NADPH:quinone reductase-like Zn-dependent oxidoreductase